MDPVPGYAVPGNRFWLDFIPQADCQLNKVFLENWKHILIRCIRNNPQGINYHSNCIETEVEQQFGKITGFAHLRTNDKARQFNGQAKFIF